MSRKIYVPGSSAADTAGYRGIRMEPLPGGYVRVHDERTGRTRVYDVYEMRKRLDSLYKAAQNELYASERGEIIAAIRGIESVCRRAELMSLKSPKSQIIVPSKPKIITP